MKPFYYGLVVYQVYDSGTIFEPNVLDITEHDLRSRFMQVICGISMNLISFRLLTQVAFTVGCTKHCRFKFGDWISDESVSTSQFCEWIKKLNGYRLSY